MVVKLNKTQIEKVNQLINLNTPITHISNEIGVNYKTMKRILDEQFNGYKGNQSCKGFSKKKTNATTLQDYLDNKVFITSYKLKLKLIEAGLKDEKCESCGITTWLNVKCPLELHHVDGNPANNNFTNLKILCPNCHALSDNYRIRKSARELKL